jgi:nitrogenase molybdenum-iron protein beta chain
MTIVVEKPRNGCALAGALETLSEVGGVVPIVHSNSGCAIQNYLSNKASGLGNGYVGGFSVPGTNFQERHIIFGGASRLREQIKNTLKVFDGGLYVVLNSCESAMVGDDIEAMTKEVKEQGESVIEGLAAGFQGDIHYGYETIIADVVGKIATVKKLEVNRNERLVNVLGIIPNHDIYFKGDLEEIERILNGIGVSANTFFNENGLEEFENAQNAALNIVFSTWGVKAAEKLKELYGTDYILFDTVPTGIEEVKDFIARVADKLGINADDYEEFIKREEKHFNDYFSRLADSFYEGYYSKRVSIVGDERVVRQLAVFLSRYLGAIIDTVIVTDFNPTEECTAEAKKQELGFLAENIKFSQDGKEIYGILVNSDAELILGSSLDEDAGKKLNTIVLETSYPVFNKVILNKTYAGIRGAVTLAEDYSEVVRQTLKLKKDYALESIGA